MTMMTQCEVAACLAEAFASLRAAAERAAAALRPLADALARRHAIEHCGVTEVDIKRVEFGTDVVVVLWNGRRVKVW